MTPPDALPGKTTLSFAEPAYFADDPVANEYETFFASLHFEGVPEREEKHPWPGNPPHPQRAYAKALLVRINEGLKYATHLRNFLVKHPALVLRLGFRPVIDSTASTQPFGFNVKRTVPSARHLRRKLQTFDNSQLQSILGGTVTDLEDEIPDLAESVAMDVKHIYAWVKENNPRQYVKERFNPERQPSGDPDCQLGVKESHNQGHSTVPGQETESSGQKTAEKEYLWGYGSGVAVARHKIYGEFVLAEHTQTFNRHDSTYYYPLIGSARTRLQQPIRRFSADAAYDAWYVYEDIHQNGGKAYIPFNDHGFAYPLFGPHGQPLCPDGREMVGSYRYFDQTRGYHAQVERCPLLFGTPTPGETCGVQHPQFAKGVGCVKYRNLELGAHLRVELDRQSEEYDTAYDDRTAAERINSQAKELGIERPKLRRMSGIGNHNTLIYIVINARALARVRAAKARATQEPP